MTTLDSDRAKWMRDLARALGSLAETATAHRIGSPPLTNQQYRALGEQAGVDTNARAAFDKFVTKLNEDPTELIDLLTQHPAIRSNMGGAGKDVATFVVMPSGGFRMKLSDMARHLTRSAVKRGCQNAVANLDRFLSLSEEGRVPGYDIVVFRGLTMSGEVEIAPGLEIVSYERAAERSLVKNETPGPKNDIPDYSSMGALILASKMTWGPCLVPPKTSKDIFTKPVTAFQLLLGRVSGIVFDLLSIVTSHRVQVLSLLCCAPEFVDVNPNFGPGSSIGFSHDDHWAKKDFTPEHVAQLQNLLRAWSRFNAKKCDTLELAVNRLASSIQRDRGRFWVQDRILDAAIALEVLYDVGASELRYRLATRAGHFLADETEERIRISGRMTSFYKARNSIAHGNSGKTRKKGKESALKNDADSGFDLAYDTVKKLLDRGDFPDWDRLLMSG